MPRRRSYKRDLRGRFARTGGASAGPLTKLRIARQQKFRNIIESDRRYVRETGDRGTRAEQGREKARHSALEGRIAALDKKIVRGLAKRRGR